MGNEEGQMRPLWQPLPDFTKSVDLLCFLYLVTGRTGRGGVEYRALISALDEEDAIRRFLYIGAEYPELMEYKRGMDITTIYLGVSHPRNNYTFATQQIM